VTTAIAALRSRRGDAPGYVREGLRSLAEAVRVDSNTDLYRLQSRGDQDDAYLMLVQFSTPHSLHALQQMVAPIGRADVLKVEIIAYDGKLVEEALLDTGAFVALADLGADLSLPTGRSAAAQAESLAESDRAQVTRVKRTAVLERSQLLDYDCGTTAASYDDVRPLTRFDRELFDTVLEEMHFVREMRVLDIGCGTGRFTELLSRAGAHATGVDRSEQMLATARAKARADGLKIAYVHADANAMLPAGRYDAVTFFFSVHYMAVDGPLWGALCEALSPGGRIVIVTLGHRHFIETYLSEYFPSIPQLDLGRFPSIPQLVRLLEEHGLVDVRMRDVAHEETTSAATLLHRVSQKFVSSLQLVDATEFETGLAAMRAAVAREPAIRRVLRAAIVSCRRAS
jgi:2-polyprenyl-3-methyl-5-hydroxy-6-metoxy-1,4-benzoquinol methylase